MKTSTSRVSNMALSTTGILVVLLFWHLFSRNFNPLILPSPLETLRTLKDLFKTGELQLNLFVTVRRTIIGYFLAIMSGVVLATSFKVSKGWYKLCRPILTIIQVIPPVVWLVLAVIWFGIADDITPVFIIFIVTLPIIVINIFAGLEAIDYNLIEMASVYKASRKQLFFEIYMPSILPHFLASIRVGLAFAWKSTIFAEFFGSNNGIGFALSMANSNLQTEKLFAWAIILILLMLFAEYLFLQPLQDKLTIWKVPE